MKKRLRLKKVTLRSLDDDTAGRVAGGGTYSCQGCPDTASCQASNCDTCASCLSACGSCGYPCSSPCGGTGGTCGYSCQTCGNLSCFNSCAAGCQTGPAQGCS